jgi:hypothetical protein
MQAWSSGKLVCRFVQLPRGSCAMSTGPACPGCGVAPAIPTGWVGCAGSPDAAGEAEAVGGAWPAASGSAAPLAVLPFDAAVGELVALLAPCVAGVACASGVVAGAAWPALPASVVVLPALAQPTPIHVSRQYVTARVFLVMAQPTK